MAHMGRSVKNVEAPRPLKSQQRSSLKNNYLVIEELIQLIESVALNLQSGINNPEPMTVLVQNLRILGPQLETVSKDILDRSFVVFRNASQDERLNIMTRLNLLELIELRAKGWEDNGINSYYKTKQANNIEMNDVISEQTAAIINTSPTFGNNAAGIGINSIVSSQQQQHHQQFLLAPGEVIRNSGKFLKPTKIPGKTYCKDEIVIRNADSGKVMGIKGRRVHMIEELSETIISFQRVNPGAKERLVQITGPCEEKINYAKQLIEDTIRRNASPVRLEPASGGNGGGGGSCSSLASSNSDDVVHRVQSSSGGGGGGGGGSSSNTNVGSNLSNRLSFNSVQNFMTSNAAAQQMSYQQQQQQQHQQIINLIGTNIPNNTPVANVGGKSLRSNLTQLITHSYSTNDASLGEYKFTVNVGEQHIKITGDNFKLVQLAKLVLDDYFSSAEFLASVEAGAALDGTLTSPISTPTTPLGQPQFIMGSNPLHTVPPLADSGIGLNYMGAQVALNADGDDEVFIDGEPQSNGLARSRRSHFSRKDSTPEDVGKNKNVSTFTTQTSINAVDTETNTGRIVHDYDHLLYYAKSPHSWKFPADWDRICQKFPSIIRNKDLSNELQRFDGDKYLELVKSASKRNISVANDDTINDGDTNE